MEEFFKSLRKIQKRERNNASLARVGDNFYKDMYSCIRELKEDIGVDPFSDKQDLLKDIQRIATEICERREHKITEAALMNIHRSYRLFNKDNPQFDIIDTTPLNLTKEEERLYFSLVDTLKDHRNDISLDKFSEELDANDLNTSSKNKEEDEDVGEKGTVSSIKKDDVEERFSVSSEKKISTEEGFSLSSEKKTSVEEGVGFKSASVGDGVEVGNVKGKVDNFLKPDFVNPDDQFVSFEEGSGVNQGDDFSSVTVLVFKDVGSIVGVDGLVYGPFHSQDVVVLPKINADILLKYRKARLVKI